MKRLFKWLLMGCVLLALLAGGLLLSLDHLARTFTESRIRAETGMDVKIGRLTIGLATPTLRIEDVTIYNTAEFGGAPFLRLPELYLEYDPAKIKLGTLHLKLVRFHLSEINIVQNKEGRTNLQDFQERQGKMIQVVAASSPGTGKAGRGQSMAFEAIDTLNLSLGKVRYSNLQTSEGTREVDMAVNGEVFNNIKSQKDIQGIAVALALKKGAAVLLNQFFGGGLTPSTPAGTVPQAVPGGLNPASPVGK